MANVTKRLEQSEHKQTNMINYTSIKYLEKGDRFAVLEVDRNSYRKKHQTHT